MSVKRFGMLAAVCVAAVGGLDAAARAEEPAAAAKGRYRVAWAAYLGGDAWNQAREAMPLADGSVLVGAQSCSAQMPTTAGVVQPKYAGDDPNLGHGGIYGGDCFLARLSGDAGRVLAATYFGGSKQERNVYGLALDRQGNVVITSATRSPDVPTTPGCFQPKYGGPPADWLVAKLSADFKKVVWCTYVGGAGDEFPRGGLAVDGEDRVYVVGNSSSADFPTTPGAFQRELKGKGDAAIAKLKADGSGLLWSTRLGGAADEGIMGVRVDGGGNVYVAGHTTSADFPVTAGAPQGKLGGKSDCWLAKLSADGAMLIYSTFLGGAADEFAEHRLNLLADGSVLLTGVSGSADFPTTAGAAQRQLKGKTDGFLTKLSPDGKRWEFSTLLGGSGGEFFLMPTLDSQENILVVGQTDSRDFPVTADALQTRYGGGTSDGVMAILSSDGSKLLYASYLGGSGEDMIRSLAVGSDGAVYLVGNTASEDFPVPADASGRKPAGKGDAYVVKLVPNR